VGDLGGEVNENMLTKLFSVYPSFFRAKVIRDNKTAKSRGYAFVSYLSQDDCIKALKELNGKYCGNRPMKLVKSNLQKRSADHVVKDKSSTNHKRSKK
jgi:RNA recognition motif-containing protein